MPVCASIHTLRRCVTSVDGCCLYISVFSSVLGMVDATRLDSILLGHLYGGLALVTLIHFCGCPLSVDWIRGFVDWDWVDLYRSRRVMDGYMRPCGPAHSSCMYCKHRCLCMSRRGRKTDGSLSCTNSFESMVPRPRTVRTCVCESSHLRGPSLTARKIRNQYHRIDDEDPWWFCLRTRKPNTSGRIVTTRTSYD